MSVQDAGTGEQSEPFGPDPRGTLMLHADGRMAALITPRDRVVPTSEADRATAFQGLVAYAGWYRLEPPDRFVTTVDVAWHEGWIGTDQVRTYVVDGDRLDIFTPPTRMPRPDGGEVTVTGRLSWTREPPR